MAAQSSKLEERPSAAQPIRILFDGRKLGDGGIGVYSENLIKGLAAHPETELTVITRTPEQFEALGVSSLGSLIDTAAPYSFDEYVRMSGRIDFSEFDVYHTPHFTLPFGIPIPTVITIHDLIHIRFPERYWYPLVARQLIKSAVRRADKILTVSNAAYTDIVGLVGKRKSIVKKMHIVPNALDPYFTEQPDTAEYFANRPLTAGRYFLAVVSMLKPHKGVENLLEAFAKLRAEISSSTSLKQFNDLKLVLVGKGTEGMVETTDYLDTAGSMKGVHLAGAVSKEELRNLYAGAMALVVPSIAEGFCLPVLEAHGQGIPVVVRPVPAILELLLEGDIPCEDFSVNSFVDGMCRFLGNRQNASGDSLAVPGAALDKFRRETITEQVFSVYRSLVERE